MLIILIHSFAIAQGEKRIHLKNTIKKFYSESEKDTISEFSLTEEFNADGKLSMEVEFINGNFGDITTFHYRDTFLFKKIITHNEYTPYDTITYVDSVLREVRYDFNPFFNAPIGNDKNNKMIYTPLPLRKGNKMIIVTNYETRNDSHLVNDFVTKKPEMKRSFYQLVHEYFTEYDSFNRKIAYFKSIDEWETNWESLHKYNYDKNGFLNEVRKINDIHKDWAYYDTGSVEKKILHIISDSSHLSCKTGNLKFPGYSEVNYYNKNKSLVQGLILTLGKPQILNTNFCRTYDENGKIVEESMINDRSGKKQVTFQYLNKKSPLVSQTETIQENRLGKVVVILEKFIYDNVDLLIESYKEENGIKYDWFIYEYTFY